jgi:hypothetical protein
MFNFLRNDLNARGTLFYKYKSRIKRDGLCLFRNIDEKDFGMYSCHASNALGHASTEIELYQVEALTKGILSGENTSGAQTLTGPQSQATSSGHPGGGSERPLTLFLSSLIFSSFSEFNHINFQMFPRHISWLLPVVCLLL